jgi:N-acyl-D-aspartate/D-glutamate deacylase
MPAERLSGAAPQMRKKGRIQVGADADITVFDAERILDLSTYEKGDTPSRGIAHVLVGGTFVVRDGKPVEGVFPGKAVVSGR